MAYDDDNDGIATEQPVDEADLRKKLNGLSIVLGKRLDSLPPRVPAPRSVPLATPTVEPPGGAGPSLGDQPAAGRPSLLNAVRSQPARPNVMPARADFPVKPIPTWEKVAGIAAAPFLPNLTQSIFQGPERKAEAQYKGAVEDYQRGLSDEERQANIENIRSEIKARDTKPVPEVKPEAEAFSDLIRQGKTPREAYEILRQAGQKPPTPSFEEQSYSEWAATQKAAGKPTDRMTFEKARAAATQKPERPERPQRQLAITPDNKVVELTPGMAVPPGTKSLSGELSLTAKTEQGEQAGQAATQYANDYLSGKQWTGPGDEALMEKFFEMAKPSSGFRMTQAQIEMLQRSRDWMGSITAKAKHAFTPEAPWFSDTQRQQIVKTMNDLAKSREAVKPGSTKGAPSAGQGQITVTDPNGGVHTFPDQASADRFKKLAGIK